MRHIQKITQKQLQNRLPSPIADKEEMIERWLAAFAADVPADSLAAHVWDHGEMVNYLWHIFSFRYVPCLTGDDARRAFDETPYEEAWLFFEYCPGTDSRIEYLQKTGRISAAELGEMHEVYVVAADFSWTYVQTHEGYLGPYFCRREKGEHRHERS